MARPISTRLSTMEYEMANYPEVVTIDEIEDLISDVKASTEGNKPKLLDTLQEFLNRKKSEQRGGTRRKKRGKKSRRVKRKSR